MLSLFLSKRFRQTKQHKGIRALLMKASTLGVMLGVTVLIVSLSVINGFEEQLEKRLLSVIPHVTYDAPNLAINDWQEKLTTLENHPDIIAASSGIGIWRLAGLRRLRGYNSCCYKRSVALGLVGKNTSKVKLLKFLTSDFLTSI